MSATVPGEEASIVVRFIELGGDLGIFIRRHGVGARVSLVVIISTTEESQESV